MATAEGFEPPTYGFGDHRSAIGTTPYYFGRGYWIRTSDDGFKGRCLRPDLANPQHLYYTATAYLNRSAA